MAFKMKLHKGAEAEYKRRHDAIWPELTALLKTAGISGYSIYLDRSSNTLFGAMEINDPQSMGKLANHPVMKRWWEFMRDIMATNDDNSPVTELLEEVFYLP